ncbi:hypothetical protein EJB05_39654, partial [Eragrostis curvula]
MDIAPPSFSLGIDLDDEDPPPAAGEQARGCAAPDPPSFSLGFDFDDDDDDEEPQLPAGGREAERARVYAAAPDPPSFSLGLGLDDEEEPHHPVEERREEQARRYEAPDAPSFSLCFDDDKEFLPGGKCHEEAQPQVEPRAPSSTGIEEEEDDSDLAAGKPPTPPEANRFKRLRRGPAPPHPAPTPQVRCYQAPDAPSFSFGIDDDDFLGGDQHHEQSRPQAAPRVPQSVYVEDSEDDDFILPGDRRSQQVKCEMLNPDPLPPPGTRRLKRLQRGPEPPHLAPKPPPPKAPKLAMPEASPVVNGKGALDGIGSFEDEIEDFTDDEQPTRGECCTLVFCNCAFTSCTRAFAYSSAIGCSFIFNVEFNFCYTSFTKSVSFIFYRIQTIIKLSSLLADVPPSVGSCSSNSKFSLLNHGVLMSQSATKAKISKLKQQSTSSASTPLEESCTKKLLPKITISPLRKIHLLDSDTDADDDQNQNKANKPASPLKSRQESMNKYIGKDPTLQQNSKFQRSTAAWKSEAKVHENWATPALDEFCSEYFNSVKESGQPQQKESSSLSRSNVSHLYQGSSTGAVLDENPADNSPPAVHYFFHQDPMVRDLVRERLQHFFPIGTESTRENEQRRAENISYGQFGLSGAATNGWVTPGRSIPVPTDVGRRRVHASGTQSGSGHWYTGEDGRKEYNVRWKVAGDFTSSGRKVRLRKAHPDANEVLPNLRKNQLRQSKPQVELEESDEMKMQICFPRLQKGQGFAVISVFALWVSFQNWFVDRTIR